MTDRKPYRHRFPLSIIQYALWLYHHFSLSQRDVQELLQARGIQVSHETLRQWNIKFAPLLMRFPPRSVQSDCFLKRTLKGSHGLVQIRMESPTGGGPNQTALRTLLERDFLALSAV